jgi:choline dehydrogenase-like flavoprotein
MDSNSIQFDAIVIGSGISGGWAAKELCEKGLKVLLLERGKPLEHQAGYTNEHKMPWEHKFAGKSSRLEDEEDYKIQSKSYAFDEMTKPFYINDKENPYQSVNENPFAWTRADVLGGRSLIWGRQSYRFSEQDFEANAADGHGVDWPIRYKDIAPWYDYVESFVGVSGQSEGLAELPDGKFLPPMPLFPVEETMKERLKKSHPHVCLTSGRTSILTKNHNGRFACHYCGPCPRGCSTGSYFSSLSSTLPAASKTGNLTIRANSLVEKLDYDPITKSVSSVQVIDTENLSRLEFSSKIVFLCASTIASTQILLNSKSAQFPQGLGNTSGVLGKYLLDHHRTSYGGLFLDHLDKYSQGYRPTGSYIPRFRNLDHHVRSQTESFVRGYGFQVNAIRPDWRFSYNTKGFGRKFKDRIRKPLPWMVSMSAFGEVLPNVNNAITLDKTRTDKFGLPQVKVAFSSDENERSMQKDSTVQAFSILKNSGAVYYTATPPEGKLGVVHEMGTARMGLDPETSYLNKYNQSHIVSNLFVSDGSAMASASCVNPSITYMALTARACDYAVNQLREGRI